MCSLRDAAAELGELGAKVYGLSFDDVASMAKFAKEQKLEFSLLSDPDGSAVSKYEVEMKGRPFARRVTFVIDPAGVIRARDEEVRVNGHGRDLVERIQRLQSE